MIVETMKVKDMIYASNMTASEFYRVNGCLSPEHIESLLDAENKLQAVEDIDGNIEEALTQYPSEDFLVGIVDRLQELSRRLRGANREELNGIIGALEDIGMTTFYAADYGRSELKKALSVFR